MAIPFSKHAQNKHFSSHFLNRSNSEETRFSNYFESRLQHNHSLNLIHLLGYLNNLVGRFH